MLVRPCWRTCLGARHGPFGKDQRSRRSDLYGLFTTGLVYIWILPCSAALKGQLHSKQTVTPPPQPSTNTTVIQDSLDVLSLSLSPPSNPILSFLTPSPEMRFQSASLSPELSNTNALMIETDPFLGLLFSGWNTDLPDPATLNH